MDLELQGGRLQLRLSQSESVSLCLWNYDQGCQWPSRSHGEHLSEADVIQMAAKLEDGDKALRFPLNFSTQFC